MHKLNTLQKPVIEQSPPETLGVVQVNQINDIDEHAAQTSGWLAVKETLSLSLNSKTNLDSEKSLTVKTASSKSRPAKIPIGFMTYENPRDEYNYTLADISIKPASAEASLSSAEVIRRMETDHVVKRAPWFRDQLTDKTRNNPINFLSGLRFAAGVHTSSFTYKYYRQTLTESESIQQFGNYLDTIANAKGIVASRNLELAQTMKENLTFIGEKEYKEAVSGIAACWKQFLDSNPNKPLCVVVGQIAKNADFKGRKSMIKSDEFLLESILGEFSDEELGMYSSRFTTNESDLLADPQNVRVIMLDDWTISGAQLEKASESFVSRNPKYRSSIEVQLVAATEARIKKGLRIGKPYYDHSRPSGSMGFVAPVRSYFIAHNSDKAQSSRIGDAPGAGDGAHITGFHSSVDYDAEKAIEEMTRDYNNYQHPKGTKPLLMPPLTNIIRPYRKSKLPRLTRMRQGEFSKFKPIVFHG